MKHLKQKYLKIASLPLLSLLVMLAAILFTNIGGQKLAFAANCPSGAPKTANENCTSFDNGPAPKYGCGSNDQATGKQGLVPTSIDLGCQGDACQAGSTTGYCATYHNPIIDAVFAIIRFLSAGVGIVIVASTMFAGIQYTLARDDPTAVAHAKERIVNNLIALLIFIFAFSLINYVVPGGFLQ